ncbi:MAG: ABC transporter permease [Syntrophomonadaceae bacterium]|jgi:NitT/TauT family transport system permease protein
MPNSTSKNSSEYLYIFLGVLAIIAGWQLISLFYSPVLVPSPLRTIESFWNIWNNGELAANLAISFQRQVTGLGIGLSLGISTGILAGLNRKLELILQPLVNALLAVPAIVFVVMAMVWFGMGTLMTVFIVALLVYPVMHLNTLEGFKSIDRDLLEMAKVYRLPTWKKINKIYLPGLAHSLIAGFSLSTASSVRLTVMAELLGAREGIGQKIAISRAYMETENLFAWVLVLILILVALELLLVKPLNAFTVRWKKVINS